MRLPQFFLDLTPVGETVDAALSETAALEAAAAEENAQVVVATATDKGLSLWEADYALPREVSQEGRRARIREALAGGATLTKAALEALCVSVGGFDRGEAVEDFPHWAVELWAVNDGALPGGTAALEAAVARLKPAHLTVNVIPCGQTDTVTAVRTALAGECFLVVPAALKA